MTPEEMRVALDCALEQIATFRESVVARDMQEIMRINNELRQALLSAERRGYEAGLEAAAKEMDECNDTIQATHIRALKDKQPLTGPGAKPLSEMTREELAKVYPRE